MKLEEQVVSLELAMKLKELGVKQESLFVHYEKPDCFKFIADEWHVDKRETAYIRRCSAFTVAELGEILTQNARETMPHFVNGQRCWAWAYDYHEQLGFQHITAETEANARAKMLIYLIEQHIIEL